MDRRRLSARKLASQAGISEGRWRQIVNGYQSMGGGQYVPVVAPPLTLARMAEVVGVDPTQLREAGRADAADELERLQAEGDRAEGPPDAERRVFISFESTEFEAVYGALRVIAEVLRSNLADSMKLRLINREVAAAQEAIAASATERSDEATRDEAG